MLKLLAVQVVSEIGALAVTFSFETLSTLISLNWNNNQNKIAVFPFLIEMFLLLLHIKIMLKSYNLNHICQNNFMVFTRPKIFYM